MRILLTGAGGQLGTEIRALARDVYQLRAFTREDLDICDPDAVLNAVRGFNPDWVINTAAYTAVDRAESDPDTAWAVNRDGPAHLAAAAQEVGARMVQVSTDYVFDGSLSRPYRPDDPPRPINVYGHSKLGGEGVTQEILGNKALILRTSWVYAAHGRNFVLTMLRLMNERDELGVVEDQIGTPTSAAGLASVLLRAIARGVTGIHHWSDAGATSWYDFAVAIREEAQALGLLRSDCRILPIPTQAYPTPAARPPMSMLDKRSLRDLIGDPGQQWRVALRAMLGALRQPHG